MELEAGGRKFTFNMNNPFGTGEGHRRLRIVLKSPLGLHPLCWLFRAIDGSLSFGFPKNFYAGYTGTGFFNKAGKLQRTTAENLEHIAMEKRISPHVTLHPSGICHLRTERHKPLVEYKIPEWYPVTKEFDFIHAYSDPIVRLPTVQQARSRDNVLPFNSEHHSAYVRIEILPAAPGKHAMTFDGNAMVVVSGGPDYVVRVSIYGHDSVMAQILINTSSPVMGF
jgi:hypothetical protein